MDLNLETEFDGEMKNTENAWKLERIAKEKGKKAIDTTWKWKPLHGQYPLRSKKLTYMAPISGSELPGLRRILKGLLLLHKIRSSSLETFRLVFFIMGQTLGVDSATQALRLLSTSSQGALFLPPNECTNRRNRAGQYIHWKICNHYHIDNIYTGKSVTIIILKHPTNGMTMYHYLLWIPQKWPFSETSPLELTGQYKLTDQI